MEIINKVTLAKYFPKIICVLDNGIVNKSSIVPTRLSSAKERIVIAGTNNKKTIGAKENKPLISANPLSKTLYDMGNTHKNNPVKVKNTPMTK